MTGPGLPEGLELDVRQDALTANPQKTYRAGDALPAGIAVEGTRERPEIRIDTDKIQIHIARLSGPGTGTIHLAGNGAGTAIRDGTGHGDAIRSGQGDGDAIRCGRGEQGDAVRMGAGLGNALREGKGHGDALRSGMGGDAVRIGPGPGTAKREERGRVTLRHRVMMSVGKTGIAATILMSAYAHTHAQPIIGAGDPERVERPVAEFRLDGPPGPAAASDSHLGVDSKADTHGHDRHDPGRSIAPATTGLEAEPRTNRVADGNEIPRPRAHTRHDGRSAGDARGDTEHGGTRAGDTEHGHREKATPERHGQKHKTMPVDHGSHDHGGHKGGHATAHKAHHEHLPEDDKERRRGKFRKAKTPLQEALERHRRQRQMARTSGRNPGTPETPTRPNADVPQAPKSMPPLRSGGGAETPVGPTPPRPASGYAAAHDHGRAAESRTR